MLANTNQTVRNRCASARRTVSVLAAAAIVTAAVSAPRAWAADDPNATVATVGDHKISEKDLDAKVKPQLEQMRAMLEKRVDQLIEDKKFDLRRQTLESMTDDYLIQQAAQKDKLSVDEYIKKESNGKDGVTDAAAKKFYDDNKGNGGAPPYDQIKPKILDMLNRQALLERLRKEAPVNIGSLPTGTISEVSKSSEALVKKATSGKLTITEAQGIADLLEGRRKVIETEDLARRVAALEPRNEPT